MASKSYYRPIPTTQGLHTSIWCFCLHLPQLYVWSLWPAFQSAIFTVLSSQSWAPSSSRMWKSSLLLYLSRNADVSHSVARRVSSMVCCPAACYWTYGVWQLVLDLLYCLALRIPQTIQTHVSKPFGLSNLVGRHPVIFSVPPYPNVGYSYIYWSHTFSYRGPPGDSL